MLKTVLFILALSTTGQPFQAQVPVESLQECIEKGQKWASQDHAQLNAKSLGFVCVVQDDRPRT